MRKTRAYLAILALATAVLVPSVAEATCQRCAYAWWAGWICEPTPVGLFGWTKCTFDYIICQDSTLPESQRCEGERRPFEKTPAPLVLVDPEAEVVSTPMPSFELETAQRGPA